MPYFPLILFAGLYLFATVAWSLPLLVGAAYLLTSLTCFVAYALDKSAARARTWRTPEATLLVLGLVGGWPGALLAQQWLRHKIAKPLFQLKFKFTVVINVLSLLYFSRRAWT